MLTRQQKEEQVGQMADTLGRANTLLAIDYRGLTVQDANALRRQFGAAEGEIEYRVAKNTLVRRAVEGTSAQGLVEFLTGPTALAISFDEPSAVAKALVDYAKDHEVLEIKGGVVEGEVVDLEAIRRLAALPSKLELRGMLAGTLQAPMRNLAGTLNSLLGNLRNALEARQAQLDADA
jgi:large subunit ribosomal protein L10